MEDTKDIEIMEKEEITPPLNIIKKEHLIFAAAVASGDNFTTAYKKAYPHRANDKFVWIYASNLAKNPKVRQQIELIQQAVRMQIILDTPEMYENMKKLALKSKSEKVQFEATKDMLNRGGLQPPQRVESVHIGIFGSASAEDIRSLIRNRIEDKEEK